MLCWIDHVWSSKECVCCACDPNKHLSAPSICFVCVFVCRKLSPRLGEPAIAMHRVLFGMLCLSAISMMFVKTLLTICMLVGMVV